jgi:hypothetical protein
MKNTNSRIKYVGVGLLATVLAPGAAWACACGCGVFDVGTSSMLPTRVGGMAFLEYDYQNQNRSQSGTSFTSANDPADKQIQTSFTSVGLQYLFNSSWGVQGQLPYAFRTFRTDIGTPGAPEVVSRSWNGLGDIRLKGIYTGFTPDLSVGLTFGLKLPTGSYNRDSDVVDRDTQIGSGSTDFLLGGFYRHNLTEDGRLTWFSQGELDVPFLQQDDYRPGVELDAATGISYSGLSLGRVYITPIAQVIGSWRGRDNGVNAAPDDSGYQRILLSPGIEFHVHPVKIYADAELPVYENVRGDQLVAPVLVKVSVSYMF